MKRTVLFALGCICLAASMSASGSTRVHQQDCTRKLARHVSGRVFASCPYRAPCPYFPSRPHPQPRLKAFSRTLIELTFPRSVDYANVTVNCPRSATEVRTVAELETRGVGKTVLIVCSGCHLCAAPVRNGAKNRSGLPARQGTGFYESGVKLVPRPR